ncbi:MAG: TauD/TfdA family dioxygenase [Pirellula sp.]
MLTKIEEQTIRIHVSASEQIRSDLEALIGKSSFQVDIHADVMGKIGSAAIGKHLSTMERQQLEQFGRGQGESFLIIEGLPVQENLPNTPQQFNDDAGVQFTDCQLLGAIDLAGLQSIAFGYENYGRLARNVAPAKTEQLAVSSHGSKLDLAWHSDNSYEFENQGKLLFGSPSPRFLCFAGLRNLDAFGKPVATELLAVEEILSQASEELLQGLQRTAFEIMPGQSNAKQSIGAVPLLQYCRHTGEGLLRFNLNEGSTIGLDSNARNTIAELSELIASIEDRVIPIFLENGSFLAFDNYRTLHRRLSFDPGTDLSKARWLRRVFACMDRAHGHRIDAIHRPYVWN